MKRLALSVLTGLFLTASAVEGADWKLITQDEDHKYLLLVDQESMEPVSDSIVRAGVKYEYTKTFSGTREYDCMKCSPKKNVLHTIFLEEFDCTKRKVRILELTEYYTDAVPYTEHRDTAWRPAAPDSADEKLISYICTQGRE